ncbi:DUF1043 family protein, partial [Salmonella enterica subsp. enterica serovar Kentucky]|nr:DUF1043 family protein [Salmonella enterica subsp. enterica serovar Kentucky]
MLVSNSPSRDEKLKALLAILDLAVRDVHFLLEGGQMPCKTGVGAVAMRFGNRKLRQQQALQYELEKNKAELEEYREELVSHFAR